MLASSSKYAIKALIFIVNNSSVENKLRAKYVAESVEVPKPFLSKILQLLAAKGYLTSTKGPNGGFYLTDAQLKNSLLDIIVLVEGKDKMHQCALNFEQCDIQNPCPVHHYIASAKGDLRQCYKEISLLDLRNS